MHMRAVEHTNRRGLCTHHAAWVNRTDYRCRGCLKSPGRPPNQPWRGCRGAFRRSFCRFGTSVELLVAYIDPSQSPSKKSEAISRRLFPHDFPPWKTVWLVCVSVLCDFWKPEATSATPVTEG